MDGSIEVEKHMLAKEKSAVPLGLTEPFAAVEWKKTLLASKIAGYGIVPKDITKIIQSEDDEIRFVISDISELFDTYNFNIPIPVYQDTQPFIAKATLCYFPRCARTQGVDYTETELEY